MGTLTLSHFLSLGAILFALSVIGIFLNRRNLIVLLMAIELMLLAVNMNFVAFSHFLGDMGGQVWRFDIVNGESGGTLVEGGVLASLGGAAVADPEPADLEKIVKKLESGLAANDTGRDG